MRKGPFRHRWFNLFVGSVGLGSIGSEVAHLAMPLLVLDLTQSLGAAALLRVVQMVPYVFFGALAGALIDRVDKRRLLIVCDVLSAALMTIVPLSVTLGAFSLELLYVVAFLLGTVEVLWGVTADFSVLPSLVEEHELTAANAAYLGADRGARVIGPLLGGTTIAALGGGVAADAAALWIAAIAYLPTFVVFLRMPPLLERSQVTASLTPANVAREVGQGFSFIWRSPILRALCVLMFVSNLGGVGIQTLLLFVLKVEQGLDAATIGLALSLTGVSPSPARSAHRSSRGGARSGRPCSASSPSPPSRRWRRRSSGTGGSWSPPWPHDRRHGPRTSCTCSSRASARCRHRSAGA